MKAKFDLEGLHRPVLVVEPDNDVERILMAAWIGYDANTFSVSVERFENGKVERLIVLASVSR